MKAISIILLGIIAISMCIPTQRRTSLIPYSFTEGLASKEMHYSFYYKQDTKNLFGMLEDAYFDIRQDEIFYLVRRSKLDYSRYKLVRYDMLTNTQETHPTGDDFLSFPGYQVYGFTMNAFPKIDGIIASNTLKSEFSLYYLELDQTTGEIKTVKNMWKDNTQTRRFGISNDNNYVRVVVHPIDPSQGHYEISSLIFMDKIRTSLIHTTTVFIVKYSTYQNLIQVRKEEMVRFPSKCEFKLYPSLAQYDKTSLQSSPKVLNNGNSFELRDIQNSDFDARNYRHDNQMVCVYVYDAIQLLSDWRTCYGTDQNNTLASTDVYQNTLFILYQETGGILGGNQNIVIQMVDFRTGLELSKKRYHGSDQSRPIFMTANHLGVFILANIENGFKDLSSSNSFTTQNSVTNFGIIYADHDGNILEIESYDASDPVNDLGENYPKRLVIGIQNKHQPIFTFMSSRDEQNDYQGGGVFITQPVNNSALFTIGDSVASCSGVKLNCELCSSNSCFKCSPGYKIQNGECKLTCDNNFFQVKDDINDELDIDICLPCHKSCLTCFDQTETGCLSCDADKVIDVTKNTCQCSQSSGPKFLGADGTCASVCGELLTARYDKKCVKTCPENSDDYLQKVDTVNARTKSSQINCQSLTKHFKVQEGVTDIPYFGENLWQKKDFTMTLWVKVSSTTNNEFTIASSGTMLITGILNSSTSTIRVKIQFWDPQSSTFSQNYTLGSTFGINEWVYLGVSLFKTNRIEELLDLHFVTRTLAGIEDQISLSALNLYLNCFDTEQAFKNVSTFPLISPVSYYLGSLLTSEKMMFTGLYNNILVYQGPITAVEMLDNALRLPVRVASTYEQELSYAFVIYNDLTPKGLADTEQTIYDLNLKKGTKVTADTNRVIAEKSILDPLNFCQFHIIEKECNFVDLSEMGKVYHSKSMFESNHNMLYNGITPITAGQGIFNIYDYKMLYFCKYENVLAFPHSWKSSSRILEKHEDIFYFHNSTKEAFSLGPNRIDVYIPTVFPDHGDSILGVSETYSFEVNARKYHTDKIGDQIEKSLYSEIIAFSKDCGNVLPGDVKIQRQSDGTFEQLDASLFNQIGDYSICWKSPLLNYEAYIKASDSYWVVRETPRIFNNKANFKLNQNIEEFSLWENSQINDEFMLVEGPTDCDIMNKVGQIFPSNSPDSLYIWLPDTPFSIHICWRRDTPSGYSPWTRIQNMNGTYSITVTDRTAARQSSAKISEFSHPIHANILPGEQFWFKLETDGRAIDSIKIISNLSLITFSESIQINISCVPSSSTAICSVSNFSSIHQAYTGSAFSILFEPNKLTYTSGGSTYNFLVNETARFDGYFSEQRIDPAPEGKIKGKKIRMTGISSRLELHNITQITSTKDNAGINSIWVEFKTTGCQNPTGTIRIANKISKYLYLTNFNSKDCQTGTQIYADFIFKASKFIITGNSPCADTAEAFCSRVKSTFFEHLDNVIIGTIGCDTGCKICAEDDPYKCIVCSDNQPFYDPIKEKCYSLGLPGMLKYNNIIEAKETSSAPLANYTRVNLVRECPIGYYQSLKQCFKCHQGCIECIGPSLTQCTACEFPNPFLLDNACVDQCDQQLFKIDYQHYKCVQNEYYDVATITSKPECQTSSFYSKDNLMVSIQTSKTLKGYSWLRLDIVNKRGNITLTKFTQEFPVADPNDPLTNVFPLIDGQTNQYVNETTEVSLNQNTLANYPSGTIFKIKAEVTNDCGDRAISKINLMRDFPPTVGGVTITCPSTPCQILEDFKVDLTGNWYDTYIESMELYIAIFFELSDGRRIPIHSSSWEKKSFSSMLPILSSSSVPLLDVNVLIIATDQEDYSTTLNQTMVINNTLGDIGKRRIYEDLGAENTLLSPLLSFYNFYPSCVYNSDCKNEGICTQTRTGSYCKCQYGYSSIDCSTTSNEFIILQDKIPETLKQIYSNLMKNVLDSRINIEDDFFQFCNVLSSIESVRFTELNLLFQVFQAVIEMPASVHSTVSDYFSIVFFEHLSKFQTRISLEYRGYNISILNQNDQIEALDKYSDIFLLSQEYLVKLSSRVFQSEPMLEFDTQSAVFKIERVIASALNGAIYTINANQNITLEFSNDFFVGSEVTDPNAVIKVISIVWKIPPKTPYISSNYSIESDMVSVLLVDDYQNVINSITKPFTIRMPIISYNSQNYLQDDCGSMTTSGSDGPICTIKRSNLLSPIFEDCSSCEPVELLEINAVGGGSFYLKYNLKNPSDNKGGASVIHGVGKKNYFSRGINKISLMAVVLYSLIVIQGMGYFLIYKAEKVNK
ncbi:unnamed protein product [Moneuplotes crassus]|uniref:EGF-like domain-containing protein n=1 Tax=Euplotes crassus TaxID=5936 RepID=A0AAD2DBJ5_EUPCR|nr:unnamed protein product [Moneuplotes crassus]